MPAWLARAGPPLAWAAADGRLHWRSERFAALAPGTTADLRAMFGADAAARLLAGEDVEHLDPAATPWRLRAVPADGGWLLQAEPLAAEREARALRERLELVQQFTRTGVFERDPATLAGRWDRTMFDIWGLPPDPEGRAPSYARTASLMLREDTRPGAFGASLRRPGPHQQRVRIRRPDGAIRHLNTQWRVDFAPDGVPRRVLGVNTDDTEVFALADRAARLSAELDAALEVSGIGLWRMDFADGRIVPDARGREILGLAAGVEGLGADELRALMHPDDLAQHDAAVERTRRGGEPVDAQLRFPAPGGGWRHVLLRRAPYRDPDGNPQGFVGVLLDVSERVEAARRALEVARRLESAAEAARVGLWSLTPPGMQPSWNRLMFELFGLPPLGETLWLGDFVKRCVHPEDKARVYQESMQWWQGEDGPHEIEFRVVRPSDGETRWIVVRGRLETGVGGLRRAEGIALDVTEQQNTLRQLRETVERMSLTTRALGLGTWTADLERRHVVWDAQMFRLRGVESGMREVGPEERSACVHPEDREAFVAARERRFGADEPWSDTYRVVWPDGQVRWITSHSVPLRDGQGRIEGRIGVNWDSTVAQLAHQARREREVAVAESQAKSEALSRISHELRTPLNAILGFTQLLRASPPAGDAADAERRAAWLQHVEDAGRHLLALIDDVLELSRAQVGELRLAPEPVSCAEVVDAALALVAGSAAERGVALVREAIGGVAFADPVRLRQVVINLLSNAIKYNRRGGQARIGAASDGRRVRLWVDDTGVGIAPEKLRDAFEPFNRLGAEASGVEGSGIGLAIVKVLVERMGGSVHASSTPGAGSRFAIELPAAAAAPPAAPQRRAPGAPDAAAPTRVLYVEDNAVNALLVAEVLAQRPAVTLRIEDTGAAGLCAALEWRPDLVLLDMRLPDMDGLQVLRALRADARTAAIACVALSANAMPEDRESALAEGFVDYWTKPIDFARFLAGIDALIARRAA